MDTLDFDADTKGTVACTHLPPAATEPILSCTKAVYSNKSNMQAHHVQRHLVLKVMGCTSARFVWDTKFTLAMTHLPPAATEPTIGWLESR